jgi:ligand-binding sensor domain-containing protein
MNNPLLALGLLSVLAASSSVAQVHTSLRHVQGCQPMSGGHTLVATAGGLLVVNGEGQTTGIWTSRSGLPATKSYFVTPVVGQTNEYWVGTEGGLVRLAWAQDTLHIRATHRTAPVRAVLQDGATLWVATWGQGLMRLPSGGTALEPVPMGADDPPNTWRRLTDIARHGNTLIVASAGAGLLTVRNDTVVTLPLSLPSPVVWTLTPSSDDSLWVGTLEGLVLVRGNHTTTLSNDDVRGVQPNGTHLLIATYGNGLRHLEGQDGEWRFRSTSAPNHAFPFVSAIGARNGQKCLGTPDGLWVQSSGASTWRALTLPGPPSNDIAAVAWDGDRLWVGTFDRGLAVYERNRWRDVAADSLSDRINALAIEHTDKGPRVWVGTARGLVAIHDGKTRRYTRNDGLPSEDIHALATRRRGGVIAGTSRGAVLVRGERVSIVGSKQGLKARVVWAVAEGRDGTLWLGSNQGLFRRSPNHHWARFSVASGHLSDDWVTALRVHRNRVWVGSYAGGITELEMEENDTVLASHLGGGFINVAGLTLWKGHVLASTMDGLLVRRPGQAVWNRNPRLGVGRDITATAVSPLGVWVAGRRGLAFFPGKSALRSRSQSRGTPLGVWTPRPLAKH